MLCITLRMLYHGFPIITALSETVVEKPHKEAFGIAFLSRTEEHTSRNTLTIWRCIKIYFFNICKNCFNQLPLVNFGPKFIYDGETHSVGEDIKLNDFFTYLPANETGCYSVTYSIPNFYMRVLERGNQR